MEEIFQGELIKDEKILWVGQPNPSVIFTGIDIFLVPFSLLWGGFAIFWEITATSMGAPFFFPLFGAFFAIFGLYFIFGRFIYKSLRKKKTYYAVTNLRVISLNQLFGKSLKAGYISSIPTINKSVRSNGTGSLRFGDAPFMASMYANSGMEFFSSFNGQDVIAFYDIEDVDKVYNLVSELRNKK